MEDEPAGNSRRMTARALSLLLTVAAVAAGCGGPKPHPIVVGAVEDAAKSGDADRRMALAARAGFRAIVLSAIWRSRLEAPDDLDAIAEAARAARANGIRPIVAVYQLSPHTPDTPEERASFAAFAASIPRAVPEVRDVIVGNEPNLNLFWLPQFEPDGSSASAPAYLALLAETYDALKAVSPAITVIGGATSARGTDNPDGVRPSHSPTRFVEELGRAYRASGRDRPVMDMYSHHPYPEHSSIPPDVEHPRNTTIGLADHGKLVDLLGEAFDGTAQPGSELPIVYGEYGLQTVIPPEKAAAYTGEEQPTTRPVDERTQGERYVEAIRIASCQETVAMLLFFHVADEPQLERLQTGVYYADETPKASLEPVAEAARLAAAGEGRCP